MQATADGTLAEAEVKFSNKSACCVVMASEGYPQKYETGFEMTIPEKLPHNAEVYVAGAKLSDGKLLTAGGRVLGVTAVADNLETAISYAYDAVKEVKFDNARCRSDIGQRALKALK